jgi:hypothetical protein
MQRKRIVLYVLLLGLLSIISSIPQTISADNVLLTVNIIGEEPVIKDDKFVLIAGIWHDISIQTELSTYNKIALTIYKQNDDLMEKNETNYYQWIFQQSNSFSALNTLNYTAEYIDVDSCTKDEDTLVFRVGVQDVLPDEIFAQQEWMIQISGDSTPLLQEEIILEKPTRGFAKSHGDHLSFNVDPFTEMQTQASDYIILKNTGNVPLFVKLSYAGLDDYLTFSQNNNIISPKDQQHYQLLLTSSSWQPQRIAQEGVANAEVLTEYIIGGESSGVAVSLQTAFIIDIPQVDIFVGHSDYMLENLFGDKGLAFQYKQSITMEEGETETVHAYISGEGTGKMTITVDDSLILESVTLNDNDISSTFNFESTNEKEQHLAVQIKAKSEDNNGKIHYTIESDGQIKRFSTTVYVQAPTIPDDTLITTGTSPITIFVLIGVIIAAGFMLYNHLSYGRKS